MEIYTIGFTKRSAESFFGDLRGAGIERLLDVRLHNRSQLAGFTKAPDLEYFLSRLLGVQYEHEPLLAPTPDMLTAYRKRQLAWDAYEQLYLELIRTRDVAHLLDAIGFEARTVLLCSEAKPDRCHRRLAAEHLAESWGGTTIVHL